MVETGICGERTQTAQTSLAPRLAQLDSAKDSSSHLLPGLTVVVPVYNSQATLRPLIAELARTLPTCAKHFEVVLVNDGSRDGSWAVIRELAQIARVGARY